ncbi:ABC transporter substrate-binding protein [Salidesulfovibrio onnuriiensis]|uniref:ABC transporter substrate-binding protein n=1 Tax=Salidesulfovibrio onnuriiensis TaxID=2583823 RepID=UPI0011C745C2|nr:ABC transporter substrate-binding protein [Salidesulfovibrio onnuriiensis]
MRTASRLSLCLFILLLLAAGCDSFSPVDIGFVGQLTGKFSDLGVAGRNGAQLAVKEANLQGGIDGRDIRLFPKDDGNTPATAIQAVQELMDQGCVAVVGPMTSGIGVALAPHLETIMISPTSSSPALSDKDDFFFRVVAVNTARARSLAEYARNRDITRVFIIGDQDNADYVNTFNNAFANRFAELGGSIPGTLEYSSNELRNWDELLEAIAQSNPQALVMSASARDVAALARRLKSRGLNLPVFCPAWSYTPEVIQAGGDSVEGFIFATVYSADNQRKEFQDFKKRFIDRYGAPPGFAATYAYEATTALITGLRRTDGGLEGLKQALLEEDNYPGIIGEFRFNEYGDVEREDFISTVKNGRFVLLNQE